MKRVYDSYSDIAPNLGTSKHKIKRKLKFLLLNIFAIQKSVSKKNWENSSTGKKPEAFCSNLPSDSIVNYNGLRDSCLCNLHLVTCDNKAFMDFILLETEYCFGTKSEYSCKWHTDKNGSEGSSDIWLSTAHWKLCSSHRSKVCKDRAFLTATPQSEEDKSVFLMSD